MHPTNEPTGEMRPQGGQGQATREMPRYKSHKTVWALEIATIDLPNDYDELAGAEKAARRVSFKEPGYAAVFLPGEMFLRYTPVPGDFMVQYSDGYKSFSPRKAFLEGYTLEEGKQ